MLRRSHDTPEDQGRRVAKTLVLDTFRDLLVADPEFRASIRPVLKSLIKEILEEERLLPSDVKRPPK